MNKMMVEIQELRRAYDLARRKVTDSYAGDDQQLMFHELDELQAYYGPKLTNKFRELFSELFLDLPLDGESDYWSLSNFDGNYSLTDKGMNVAYERLRVRSREIEELRLKKKHNLDWSVGRDCWSNCRFNSSIDEVNRSVEVAFFRAHKIDSETKLAILFQVP